MSLVRKIKESIITKWIVLYYTFFFILGTYLLLQLLFTTLQFLFFGDPQQAVTLQGFNVVIDGVDHQIWDLPQFHISIIISSVIIAGMIWLATKLVMKGNPIRNLGFIQIRKEHYVWFLYSLVVLCVGILLREFVIGTTDIVINAENSVEKILILFGLVLFGPLFEEVLFRGYLQTRTDAILNNKYPWISILVTAALFSVFHFQYAPLEMIYIFGIGIFLSLMRLKTGSLWFPIIFHVVGNLYAVLTIIL